MEGKTPAGNSANVRSDYVKRICESCGACDSLNLPLGTLCTTLRKEAALNFEYPQTFPQTYSGNRFSSDAMDCSLPIAMDSHSGCSYNCLYCFSNNLFERRGDRVVKTIQESGGPVYKEWPISRLERFLARENKDAWSRAAYTLMDRGAPIQLGALGDPFDDLEIHSGWAKKAIPLFIKYKQPVRVSTKGGIALQNKEYLRLFEKSPEQFWIAWSIICNDDARISRVDIKAPVTSERLKAMKALTDAGCHCSLRFRPFLPGLSDSYPGEPEAWRVLMERARAAGAEAVSFEFIFLNTMLSPRQKAMYQLMFRAMENPDFGRWWNSHSNPRETCRRASRALKYEMTMKVRDKSRELGLRFGISDPHFKELNDTGSCCGLPESDPWFGKWSRRQMTEVIVQARRAHEAGKPRLFNYADWRPEWAHMVPLTSVEPARSWHAYRRKKFKTFGDAMRDKWNDPNNPRGPYQYFGKTLVPVGVDSHTGDLAYEYRSWNIERETETIYRNLI